MTDRRTLLPDVVRGSYAVRLGLALTFAIVVMIAVGGVISIQASATLEEDVQQNLVGLSDSQAGELETWIRGTERSVRATSDSSELNTDDTEEINEYLERLVENNETSENVAAVHYLNTTSGTFEASSNEDFIGVQPAEQGAVFAENPPQFDSEHDTHVTEPFEVPIADHPIIAVLSPVTADDEHVLVYMTDVQERTQDIGDQHEDTFTIIVNEQGQYVAHPNSTKILTDHGGNTEMLGTLTPGERKFMENDDQVMGTVKMETNDWVVMVHSDRDEAFALADQINSNLVGLILFAIINLGLVGVTVGTNTVTSLRRLADRAQQMGEGDLDVDLDTSREDEIGVLYQSFDQMRTSLREKIQETEEAREEAEQARKRAEEAREEAIEESEVMQQINEELEAKAAGYRDVLSDAADGDLTRRVDPESDNEAMQAVGEEINTTLDALEEIISTTKSFAQSVLAASDQAGQNADEVDEASQQVRDSIQDIFEGASEQSERLQDAASEMEGLSATAEEVASSAQEVAGTSQAAAEVGQEGRDAAEEAIDEMRAIDTETDATVEEINALADDLSEIGNIVDLIQDIVEQTNMLALNASIEAAHADTSGDGFAVVADEIKNLAEETKDAAGDIEDRIDRIQSQAGETVDTMEETSDRITAGTETVEDAIEALERIVEYTEEVDVGIQEIDDATEEQAHTAQNVMELIDELTDISQQTASEADSVANAAERQTESIGEVADSSQELRESAKALDDLLDRFSVAGGAAASGGSVGQGTSYSGGDE